MGNRYAVIVLTGLALLGLASCRTGGRSEVVVYTALDQEFSQPVLHRFQEKTGITVRPVYDIESTKTVGLYQRILWERDRPQCDVFWNNEILHTLRLARQGLLESYFSPEAQNFPEKWRSRDGYWVGFAGRARVLLVNRQLVSQQEQPRSIRDLADSRWEGKCGMARPLFGTTATHAAVLFSQWGDDRATEFFEQVKKRAAIFSGNKQVALAVSAGRITFGLTDTDDALIEVAQGRPVEIVWPDQGADEPGTLLLPNTVAILRGAPHPAEARRLVDFLLSAEVEDTLANCPSGQIPLRSDRTQLPAMLGSGQIKWMDVDFEAVVEAWERAAPILTRLFP